MPFIKRHVTRRLKAAKQECDKDLQRVTNAITAFFEERLREADVDRKFRLHFSVYFLIKVHQNQTRNRFPQYLC